MKNVLLILVLILAFIVIVQPEVAAQCPMCKISAESNLRDGGSAGKGLNNGILYMFALPYLLVGSIGYLWYKNKKNYDNDTKEV